MRKNQTNINWCGGPSDYEEGSFLYMYQKGLENDDVLIISQVLNWKGAGWCGFGFHWFIEQNTDSVWYKQFDMN